MALSQADYVRTAAALAAMMVRRRLEAGEVLFASGDPADEFYLIEQGHILAEVGQSCFLQPNRVSVII